MPIAIWDGSLAIGHEVIDQHHEHLVELLNKAYDHLCDNKPPQDLEAVLDELADYATYHFIQEEHLMETIGYPRREEQVREHEYFVRRFCEIQKDFVTGSNPVSLETISFLKNWLINHITQKDTDLGAYVRVHGAKS